MTTAAQNIPVFLRKSPLLKEHFFELLKTAISSNACGMSTLKSPPSRGSDAPHVHSRLRKHLSRCTLDCGFKTSESPALRGFVAGLQALATAALYLAFRRRKLHIPHFRRKRRKLTHSAASPLPTEPASLGFKPIRRRSMLSGRTGKQTVLYSLFSRLSSTFLDPALPNSQTSEAFADWRRKIARPG